MLISFYTRNVFKLIYVKLFLSMTNRVNFVIYGNDYTDKPNKTINITYTLY